MESITIEILNPKAKQIIKDLADLKLITISKPPKNNELKEILKKLRSKINSVPSFETISKEVESVRTERYANKA